MATTHKKLLAWVEEKTALVKPENTVWCDGSKEEYDRICDIMVQAGTAIRLNEARRPNSYYVRSDPAKSGKHSPPR